MPDSILEKLLNTKLKRKLLMILFSLPKRSFHANELRLLSSSIQPGLSLALRELVRAGVVETAVKRRHRYYRINAYFPFYQELEDLVSHGRNKFSLFGRSPAGREDEVSRRLKQINDLKLIILTGIFTLQPQLPVDLLLVGEQVNRPKLQETLKGLEKLAGQELNYTVLDPQEFDQRRFLSDRLIRDVLDNPHVLIFKP